MNYNKFYKYILKRNINNPDIEKNFKFNQQIKKDYGKQLSLQNDLDSENLVISEVEAIEFVQKYGDKYEVIIDEYNTVIEMILDHIETKSTYNFNGKNIKPIMSKVYLKALAKDLSDHRLNISKIHPGYLYKAHYKLYHTTYRMFLMMYEKATKKTRAEKGIIITEQEAKQFGYTYTLQRTYSGIKATITGVNQDNSILFIPSMIGPFPVVGVQKVEVGSSKRNHIVM